MDKELVQEEPNISKLDEIGLKGTRAKQVAAAIENSTPDKSSDLTKIDIENFKTLLDKVDFEKEEIDKIIQGLEISSGDGISTEAVEKVLGDPEIEELRAQIPAVRSMQSRVVTKDDLLARVYTLPSDFGRVFRAGIHQNPNNPLAAELYVVCRDSSNKLTLAPDSLKKNLRKYINEFRLISDAIEILDATVINLRIEFAVVVDPGFQKQAVVQEIIRKLKPIVAMDMIQIDQPIIMTDLMNSIINTIGVISLTSLDINCLRGIVEDRLYSDVSFNVTQSTAKGLIVGPPGSIFEIRYPNNDIINLCKKDLLNTFVYIYN